MLLRSACLQFREFLGRIVNLSGTPGFVRSCDYKASICPARVSVRVGTLFTVVSVNGLDVYFHRLTGRIDGVGATQIADCRPGLVVQSSNLDAPLSAQPRLAQNQNHLQSSEECRH